MGAVVALDTLFNGGRVWKGRPAAPPASVHPTGLDGAGCGAAKRRLA